MKKTLLFSCYAFLLTISLATVSFASVSSAQNIVKGITAGTAAITMNDVLEIAKGFGSAKLGTTSDGDLKLDGRMEGVAYAIYSDVSANDATVSELLFSAYWTDSNLTIKDVNEVNAKTKAGKVYIDDDGDLILELFAPTLGATYKNVDEVVDWYRAAITAVKKTMEDKKSGN